jgi:hypothetical protein
VSATAVPFRVVRCLCGCDGYVVLNVERHSAPFGTLADLWTAQRFAEAANAHFCPPDGEGWACDRCGSTVIAWAA